MNPFTKARADKVTTDEADFARASSVKSVVAKSIGVVLAATALCGIGAGAAFAATPTATSSNETLLVYRDQLKGLQSVRLPDYQCPADHPWLENVNLAPGRIVPPGVSVDEPGSVGVTIDGPTTGVANLTVGWSSDESSATNWDINPHLLSIYATCTNEQSQGYPAAD